MMVTPTTCFSIAWAACTNYNFIACANCNVMLSIIRPCMIFSIYTIQPLALNKGFNKEHSTKMKCTMYVVVALHCILGSMYLVEKRIA